MHRSGTSLLAGILNKLGVSLPGQSISGDVHNPDGYFEWDRIVSIQERLLVDLHRWWPSAEGSLDLPVGWLKNSATRQAYQQLLELVADVSVSQKGLWLIKDPRCSRLLPLWLELCNELSIPLRLLLAVRDPAEVVTSLVSRDGPLVGMDLLRAQQLWWRHNLEAIHSAQDSGIPWSVVHFDRWFLAPNDQLDSIISFLPELFPSPLQREQAILLINPKHRRSLRASDPSKLNSSVRRLHRRLLRTPLPLRWPPASPHFGVSRLYASSQNVSPYRPQDWQAWLDSRASFPAPRFCEAIVLETECQLSVCGCTWLELRPHLLIQYLPISDLHNFSVDFDQSHSHQLRLICNSSDLDCSPPVVGRVALNLELPSVARTEHWLAHLRSQQLIFDPVPSRVLLLRALGLPAWWIDPDSTSNGWLQLPQAVDVRQWAARLGLYPSPSRTTFGSWFGWSLF